MNNQEFLDTVNSLNEEYKALLTSYQNLHRTYGSTSVCWGGIGGQMFTSHCGAVCENPVHLKDSEEFFRASQSSYVLIKRLVELATVSPETP